MLKILRKIRINKCMPYCQGRILDIGCGYNELVRSYGNGVGVDVYPWKGADIVCDTTSLPFQDNEFDRVFIAAALNHIPLKDREKVLKEARRVLKQDGKIVLTMIGPRIGFFWHQLGGLLWDKDQKERGMKEGEAWGLSKKEMKALLTKMGFTNIATSRFELGLNVLYVADKLVVN